MLPYTIGDFLAERMGDKVDTDHPAFADVEREVTEQIETLLSIDGSRTVDSFHRELGKLLWDYCGMERSEEGLKTALEKIPALREEYWRDVKVLGRNENVNQALEKAGRVADFFELAELMCIDALDRDESCGAHFRVTHQTEDGEARRNDEEYAYVAAWEHTGDLHQPALHKEELEFENVKLTQRSYK